jgi:hypothetical protein
MAALALVFDILDPHPWARLGFERRGHVFLRQ